MIIHNLDVKRIFALPAEAEPPLVIDAEAVLAGAVSFQGFQPVAGRQHQVAQFPRAVQLRQLPKGNALNLRRQSVVAPALP